MEVEYYMKDIKETLLRKIARGAYETAKSEANSACLCFAYQPAMPDKVKNFKKRK